MQAELPHPQGRTGRLGEAGGAAALRPPRPDMLDERARSLIGYADPRDLTLLLKPR